MASKALSIGSARPLKLTFTALASGWQSTNLILKGITGVRCCVIVVEIKSFVAIWPNFTVIRFEFVSTVHVFPVTLALMCTNVS